MLENILEALKWQLLVALVVIAFVVAVEAFQKKPAPQLPAAHFDRPVTFCMALFGRLPPELTDADCSHPNVRDI